MSMDISKVFKTIIIESPFYGIFLSIINKRFDQVDTVRVVKKGINYELAISEEYFNKISFDNAKAHMLHEVIHIALFHPIRIKDFENKKIAHMAMDIVVNQYIPSHLWKECPVNYIKLEDLNENLEKFKLPILDDEQSVEYYYEKLISLQSSDDISLEEFGTSDFNIETAPEWNEFYNMSEIDSKLLQKVTEGMLQNTRDTISKGRGHLPGELSGIFELIDKEEPPKFNWKAYLRKFVGNCLSSDVKGTRNKENIRYPDATGKKIKQLAQIFVAIDTSGSVDKDLLQLFFNELKHLNHCGVEVDIMQCDTKAYDVRPIKEYTEDSLVRLDGRGGTDFNPPVNYYCDNLKKYQALIYFTDGECSPPSKTPPNALWIIPETKAFNELLPGKVIQISL
jgi:predicted metal-dependent peptidase